jgi:hypothetical protein
VKEDEVVEDDVVEVVIEVVGNCVVEVVEVLEVEGKVLGSDGVLEVMVVEGEDGVVEVVVAEARDVENETESRAASFWIVGFLLDFSLYA